jgi:multidrug efflux pump subunit AcrA (membrane-fusion protein)
MRSLFGLVLVAAAAGLLALAGLTLRDALVAAGGEGPGRPGSRERVVTATVVPAVAGPQTPVLTVYGEVRSRRALELRVGQGGRILSLAEAFEDGGRVTAGSVLLRIDPADAEAARAIAAADLATAEAEAADARSALALAADDLAAATAQAALYDAALDRQRSMRDRGVGTDAAVEQAELAQSGAVQAVLSRRTALARAEARVAQAAATLDRQRVTLSEAERSLRETVLTAPFDGVLAGVSVVAGRLVQANEQVASLIDPDALEVSAPLSTAQYARLTDAGGALMPLPVTVTLQVAGAEITAPGRLTRAAAAVAEGQTGRQVFAAIEAPRGFQPGDFVALRIAEPPIPAAIALPATAVGEDGTVLALGEDDRLQVVPVTLLRRTGALAIVEARGLDGREVVADRSPLLGAGIRISPVREAAPAAAAETAAAGPEMVVLTPERRAALRALVEGNARMPDEAKARVLAQLEQDRVPAQVIARLEARGGG